MQRIRRLNSQAFRVVGDPAAKVRRIAVGAGGGMPRFSENVDVVFGGEGQEVGGADNTGYALDAASLGMAKGFTWIPKLDAGGITNLNADLHG